LLRNVGINVLVYGAFVIFAAWLAGPSRPARWVRRVLTPTARDHPWVIYGFVALVLLLILISGPTDGQRIYPLLVVFVLAFIGVEVLRRQMLDEFPDASVGLPRPRRARSARTRPGPRGYGHRAIDHRRGTMSNVAEPLAISEHAVTEIVKLENRGHALTIDAGWRQVAQTALDFVNRFV